MSPLSDFIADVQALFADAISPELFKLWSGIALIAGAMERRIWAVNSQGQTYANLYILLVGPPGTGKGIVNQVRRLWDSTVKPGTTSGAFKVAPDSMTKAALIDTLADSTVTFLPPKDKPYVYSALAVASEEFSILLPAYDMEYVGVLNGIWNNEASHRERRRYGRVRETTIPNPMLNIIAGTQPSYMASLFPEEAWNSGLARRLLMIYSADRVEYDLFGGSGDKSEARSAVLRRLGEISTMWGELAWEPAAIGAFRDWRQSGEPPVPEHSKLVHYNTTRSQYVFKLAMISSICQGNSMKIALSDFERARSWLLLAEQYMADVFRAMLGKSDKDVLDELYRFAMAEMARGRGKPVDGQLLRRFLIERVPHEKVEGILTVADRAGLVVRIVQGDGADRWMPKVRMGRGVE